MIILGIDPGYERLGVAVVEKKSRSDKEHLLFSECFKTSAKLTFEDRLSRIGQEVKKIIKKYKIDTLAIETLFLNTNQKTVMQVAEVRGVIIYEAKNANLKVFEASPPQIKVATTGYGKANKEQMMKMVRMLIKIDEETKSDDELDAIAIALTAFAYIRF
ncbi:MAG: crossover junction endodeoxyribonuclease RuvC [Candidatus Paceibacterota bacterium]|jgi:crossover junction endodeoxyribonuclease RuvC